MYQEIPTRVNTTDRAELSISQGHASKACIPEKRRVRLEDAGMRGIGMYMDLVDVSSRSSSQHMHYGVLVDAI
ncbi:hypothetical protein N7540_004085 [Penicillium herquei]|nr:hypothetical protein N7540_004085 [Penicillium herquei]